jgi:hypothetical protein
MSATTMAVATMTETEDPPGSWPGHAALPVPDVAMSVSVHAPGVVRAPRFFIVQAGPCQFKQC